MHLTVPEFEALHDSCMRLAGQDRIDEAWTIAVAVGGDKKANKNFTDYFTSLGQPASAEPANDTEAFKAALGIKT